MGIICKWATSGISIQRMNMIIIYSAFIIASYLPVLFSSTIGWEEEEIELFHTNLQFYNLFFTHTNSPDKSSVP